MAARSIDARVALGAIADDVGIGGMQVEAERHVAHRRLRAAADAELQQAIAGARQHGEGARGDLRVELARIAERNAIEGARARSDTARTNTSMRPVELFGLAAADRSFGSFRRSCSGTR